MSIIRKHINSYSQPLLAGSRFQRWLACCQRRCWCPSLLPLLSLSWLLLCVAGLMRLLQLPDFHLT